MRVPTLHEVARLAGVSYSTADRVVNQRGGVAQKSVARVLSAIEELGYKRDIHAANLSRRRNYRFRFFLPQGDHGFFSVLRQALEVEAPRHAAERVVVSVREVPALDAAALADGLNQIGPDECDCVAIVGADSDEVSGAVARLTGMGIPVVTLVSDTAPDQRRIYIGINNIVAGRTAGRLLRLAHGDRQGRVLPVLGSQRVHDHRDRLDGARQVLAETNSTLTLLAPIEVQDRPERMHDLLGAALARDPQITGIYSIGAGNRALIRLMEAWNGANRPFVVLHELTPHSRFALERGLIDIVIDQKPTEEIALALTAMRAIADNQSLPRNGITPTIYLKENLPDAAENGEFT